MIIRHYSQKDINQCIPHSVYNSCSGRSSGSFVPMCLRPDLDAACGKLLKNVNTIYSGHSFNEYMFE